MTILKIVAKLGPSVHKVNAEHKKFAYEKTAKRLDAKTDRKDFMSYILRYNDKRGMSRKELLGTSELLVLAGSETTATLLSGVTYYLLKIPRAYEKNQRGNSLTYKPALKKRFACIHQFPLRYLGGQDRRATLLVVFLCPEILSYRFLNWFMTLIREQTLVGVAQFASYHSTKNFFEPETFAPERWLPNPPEQYRNGIKEVVNPFSTGPRNCIGKNLAYNEMCSVVARMIWHFDMQLCEESERWIYQKFSSCGRNRR